MVSLLHSSTMDAPDFDVDSYKNAHESNVEWRLRRHFLELHKDKYPLKRLICLASCFINHECYQCTYPGPVMIELKELMEEMSVSR